MIRMSQSHLPRLRHVNYGGGEETAEPVCTRQSSNGHRQTEQGSERDWQRGEKRSCVDLNAALITKS